MTQLIASPGTPPAPERPSGPLVRPYHQARSDWLYEAELFERLPHDVRLKMLEEAGFDNKVSSGTPTHPI
jgi:hypothetical protein